MCKALIVRFGSVILIFEQLKMMSMISLFYQDVEHDVDYKYRDVEHGSRQGLDGVGGGEGGDCRRSPAR